MDKILIRELLEEQKYKKILELGSKRPNKTLKIIQMNLFGEWDDPLRWSAIEAIGRLTKDLAPKYPELYKNLIRRFLWAMNDESGNVPWSSAEGIGVIITNQPGLYGSFTPMLITNSLENFICFPGLLWSVGKIAQRKPSLIIPFVDKLLPFLESEDSLLLGHAVWAFGELGYADAKKKVKKLQNRTEKIVIYKDNELQQVSVGELALEALNKNLGLEVGS